MPVVGVAAGLVAWAGSASAGAGEPAPRPIDPPCCPGGFVPLRQARLVLSLGSGMQRLDRSTAAANRIGYAGPTLSGSLDKRRAAGRSPSRSVRLR
jgi:hypothetical protein